jgi:diguanylate cyclase (GGDEF)-like protein
MTNIEDRVLNRLLRLMQDLSSRVLDSESLSDLFDTAFAALFDCVPFDVAAAVMPQQNIDLYIVTRRGAEHLADQRLLSAVKRTMMRLIPVSLTNAEIVVRAERHDLPAAGSRSGIGHDIATAIREKGKPAGFLLIARPEPFTSQEQQILDIFAANIELIREHLGIRQKIGSLEAVDPLTGLPNRKQFRQLLSQEMDRARVYDVPLSILMIDVDDFEEISRTFSHVIGDMVLSEVCGMIRETLRTPDSICRYGPAEFAVILPHTDMAGTTAVAERILERLKALEIGADESRSIRCSVSIGIAQLTEADQTFNDLLRRADEQLFAARRQGRNRYAV